MEPTGGIGWVSCSKTSCERGGMYPVLKLAVKGGGGMYHVLKLVVKAWNKSLKEKFSVPKEWMMGWHWSLNDLSRRAITLRQGAKPEVAANRSNNNLLIYNFFKLIQS